MQPMTIARTPTVISAFQLRASPSRTSGSIDAPPISMQRTLSPRGRDQPAAVPPSRPLPARSAARRTAPTCARRCRRRRTCGRPRGSSSPRSRPGASRTAAARLFGSGPGTPRLAPTSGTRRIPQCREQYRCVRCLARNISPHRAQFRSGGGLRPCPSTVRVEGRRTVRTDDPQVLEPVVVSHSVDVVEDHRHGAAPPHLALAAQLAARLLQSLLVKPPLQIAAGVGRVLDQDLLQRSRLVSEVRSMTPRRDRSDRWRSPTVSAYFFRVARIATGRAIAQPTQCFVHDLDAAIASRPLPRCTCGPSPAIETNDLKPRRQKACSTGEPGLEPG